MQFVQGFLAGVGRLWSKGCLGKAAVIFSGLMVLGLCGAITGGGGSPPAGPAPAATAVKAAATTQATEPPAATAARATERPTIAPTTPPAPTEAPAPTAQPKPKPTAVPVAPQPKPTAAPAVVPASFDHNGDGKVTCADFSTQAAAQRALEAGHRNLDGNDKDGRACESLP